MELETNVFFNMIASVKRQKRGNDKRPLSALLIFWEINIARIKQLLKNMGFTAFGEGVQMLNELDSTTK